MTAHIAICTIATGAARRPGDHRLSSTMWIAYRTALTSTNASPTPIPAGPPVSISVPAKARTTARKNGACSRADRELAAGGHAMHKGGHDQGGQQEPELEEGQGRVLCDRVLDQDERPAPDRGDHHQQEDVDQWSDCGRHGA